VISNNNKGKRFQEDKPVGATQLPKKRGGGQKDESFGRIDLKTIGGVFKFNKTLKTGGGKGVKTITAQKNLESKKLAGNEKTGRGLSGRGGTPVTLNLGQGGKRNTPGVLTVDRKKTKTLKGKKK